MSAAKKRKIDLNKMRAARLEALGEGPTVVFGATTFRCPPEIPFMVIEAFGRMEKAQAENEGFAASVAMLDSVRALLAEDQMAQFLAENPSTDDMVNFITEVFKEYGVEAGESPASQAS